MTDLSFNCSGLLKINNYNFTHYSYNIANFFLDSRNSRIFRFFSFLISLPIVFSVHVVSISSYGNRTGVSIAQSLVVQSALNTQFNGQRILITIFERILCPGIQICSNDVSPSERPNLSSSLNRPLEIDLLQKRCPSKLTLLFTVRFCLRSTFQFVRFEKMAQLKCKRCLYFNVIYSFSYCIFLVAL